MSDQNDEKDPWGWSLWKSHTQWKNRLDRALAHKALGIPDRDDMHISNTRSGLGWKELAVIGAMLLGGGWLWQQTVLPDAATNPVPDSEYEIRFFDADGKPIQVPHISQRPR